MSNRRLPSRTTTLKRMAQLISRKISTAIRVSQFRTATSRTLTLKAITYAKQFSFAGARSMSNFIFFKQLGVSL